MENKKTTDLVGRKKTLKSKLMAAVSMLLVSAIMVSVTTYAWFILSTAPEVKGMSTTVGSNGALEMALVDYKTDDTNNLNEILKGIRASVGDSSATSGDVKAANKTWGNLVDLSDSSYGLGNITLFPAQLSDLSGLVRTSSLLNYAVYGTDGRIANLSGTTQSGVMGDKGFVASDNAYGVRAIGRGDTADPIKKAFNDAVRGYKTNSALAASMADAAFTNHVNDLSKAYMKHGLAAKDGEDKNTYSVTLIRTILDELMAAEEKMELALKYAIAAETNSAAGGDLGKITTDFEGVNLTDYTQEGKIKDAIEALQTLKTNITTAEKALPAQTTEEDGTLMDEDKPWDKIGGSYKELLVGTSEGTTIYYTPEGSETEKSVGYEEVRSVADELIYATNVRVTIKSGLYKEMADITGKMQGDVNVGTSASGTVEAKDPTYKADVDGLVEVLGEPEGVVAGASGDTLIADCYGYAIDLAFRTNADNNQLRLSTARNRVDGDNADSLKGEGSTFTFDGAVDENVVKALRVAFVDKDGKVQGIAKLGAKTDKTYALDVYEKGTLDNGVLTLGAKKTDNTIMTLKKNTPTLLTAVVYLDGSEIDNTVQSGITGKLNLQFCGSAELTPMGYSGYSSGISLTDADGKSLSGLTLESNDSAVVKAMYNGAALTEGSFSWTSSVDNVVTITNNDASDQTKGAMKITASAAGTTTTITVSYGSYSKSFTVAVKAAPTHGEP